MLDKLEELVGEIRSFDARNDVERVLNRLVMLGATPDEAIILVHLVWESAIEDLYFNPNLEV